MAQQNRTSGRRRAGRVLLALGALLLLATAAIHAGGAEMVDRWTVGLGDRPRSALRLVWLSDSADWAVVAILWFAAALRAESGWRAAALLAGLIPATAATGVIWLDPAFFGGYLLLGSTALAACGLLLLRPASAAR